MVPVPSPRPMVRLDAVSFTAPRMPAVSDSVSAALPATMMLRPAL